MPFKQQYINYSFRKFSITVVLSLKKISLQNINTLKGFIQRGNKKEVKSLAKQRLLLLLASKCLLLGTMNGLGSHKPELCPSQSSCKKRKRSQVNSSSCRTFSPAGSPEGPNVINHFSLNLPLYPHLHQTCMFIQHRLNQKQSQIIATFLSEALKIMRLTDRCTFSW